MFQRNKENRGIFYFGKVIYSKRVLIIIQINDVYEGQTIYVQLLKQEIKLWSIDR